MLKRRRQQTGAVKTVLPETNNSKSQIQRDVLPPLFCSCGCSFCASLSCNCGKTAFYCSFSESQPSANARCCSGNLTAGLAAYLHTKVTVLSRGDQIFILDVPGCGNMHNSRRLLCVRTWSVSQSVDKLNQLSCCITTRGIYFTL